jgi:hypothetical protein
MSDKTKFLGATIERESRGNGLFAYRMTHSPP